MIFVIDFKVRAIEYAASAIEQVLDYALNLKNFHEGSQTAPIVPVLIATHAPMRAINLSASPKILSLHLSGQTLMVLQRSFEEFAPREFPPRSTSSTGCFLTRDLRTAGHGCERRPAEASGSVLWPRQAPNVFEQKAFTQSETRPRQLVPQRSNRRSVIFLSRRGCDPNLTELLMLERLRAIAWRAGPGLRLHRAWRRRRERWPILRPLRGRSFS